MALLADRVKETTTTTGTGTVSLAGAPAGFQSFNTAFANGSLVYYVIQGGAEWEIGIGTTGTGTLARTQVLQSSNADALVPFSAGVKDVFCSYVADRAVTTVDAATLTNKTLDDYTNNIGANSTHFRIKATGTLSKGTVVKATGYNPGENAIEVAVVTSATDLVLGISEQALTAGQFGLAVVIGELFDVNTNGFTVGNIIYSNGSGGFTQTKPSSGTYQPLGWIVRANASNGVIAVNIVAPLYVETSNNTANTAVLRDGSGNFSAGTITASLTGSISGNAATATALQTARTINGTSFDGTANITVTAAAGTLTGTTLASGVTASSLTSVGTLSSLTVSGNVTVDTNTLFVDATNNLVGIGTASPSSFYTGGNNLVVGTGTGTNGATIYSGNTGEGFLLFADSTSGADRYRGIISYDHNVNAMYFSTNATERARIDSSGNLAVDTNTLYVDAVNNLVGIGDTPSTLIFTGSSTTASRAQIVATDNTTTLNLTTAALAIQNDSTTDNTGVALNFVSRNSGNSRVAHAAIYGLTGPRNSGWNTGSLIFATSSAGAAPTERARIDSAGNLGLGVTPSAWTSTWRSFDILGGSLLNSNTLDLGLASNAYYNGTNWIYKNNGPATNHFMDGTGVFQWNGAGSGTAGNVITFARRMTLDASGRLLVGTTTAGGMLTVKAPTTTIYGEFDAVSDGYGYLTMKNNGTACGYVGPGALTTGNQMAIASAGALPITFGTNSTERARITSGGVFEAYYNALFKKTDATSFITIDSTSSSYQSTIYLAEAGSNKWEISKASGGSANLFIYSAGSSSFPLTIGYTSGEVLIGNNTDNGAYNLQCNGTGVWGAGAYVNGSDARLKENVQPMGTALEIVQSLRPVTFRYKADYSKDQSIQPGFIAQELQAALAETDYVDGVVQVGHEYLNVAYQSLIPVLTKAIQELTARVVALESN